MLSDLPAWALPIVLSSLALGLYNFSVKQAVQENAVVPVVFLSTLCGTVSFLLWTLFSGGLSASAACTAAEFFLIALKSVIVAASWLLGYYGMRELPLSIAVPIRATAPLWTFFGGLLLFSEVPTILQGVGILCIFGGYYAFSILGQKEGISFRRHRGLHSTLLGMLLGAGSALYDKYLLNILGVNKNKVQFWFSILLAVIFGMILLYRTIFCEKRHAFRWRWSIPATGVLLIVADYLYFHAVSVPDARISILSLIRRSGCVVAFTIGVLFYHEKNIRAKAFALALILFGVALLLLFK